MSPLSLTCALGILLAVSACKTQRTVVAGPTNTGTEANGPTDAHSRFSNQDPSGYLQNSSQGENAMSSKMFGGKLDSQTTKEFNANKNFLVREFGSTREYGTKSWNEGAKGRTWTDQLFQTKDTPDSASNFYGSDKTAATRETKDVDRTARTRDFAGADRMARTSNYRPAEKALSDGRDNPKLTTAKPTTLSPGEQRVRDRISSVQASSTDIQEYLGKP